MSAARPAAAVVCLLCLVAAAENPAADFSGAEVGKPPPGVDPVGNAGFVVAEFEGRKVLELPGEPLDTYAALFGPAGRADLDASARAWGAGSGRRFPEFGIGLGDTGGYRLFALPGQRKLELRRGDDKVVEAPLPFEWRSGTWTVLRLRQGKVEGGKWKVQAKAWAADDAEPRAWAIEHDLADPPAPGRASVWAVPFSGQPIRFDQLTSAPTK